MRQIVVILSLVLANGTMAMASLVDQIFVFGDSLSDNGNTGFIFQNFPNLVPPGSVAPIPPAYTPGSYTDGPATIPSTNGPTGLWIDQFAAKLGVADPQPAIPQILDPALPSGTNYAVASATSGPGLPNMEAQVGAYLNQHPIADPNALYIVFGGSNDLFNGTSTDPGAVAAGALAAQTAEIQELARSGGKLILWFNTPALNLTPLAAASGPAAQAFLQAASEDFSNDWAAQLAIFHSEGLDVAGVNLYSLTQGIVADPSAYGFTNVTTPAQGMPGVDPNQYLFWDLEHPTTAGDAFIADAAYNAVIATPEPSFLVPTGFGLLAAVLIRRRKVH